MTYFPDGSPYEYFADDATEETWEGGDIRSAINVGWLSEDRPYPHGDVPAELVRALARLCRQGLNRMRGFHYCEFCDRASGQFPEPAVAGDESGEFVVGSAEIRVPSPSGAIFAAPDMIIHYVTEHSYRPPDEFLEALRYVADRDERASSA
jgi:hypothetical protein